MKGARIGTKESVVNTPVDMSSRNGMLRIVFTLFYPRISYGGAELHAIRVVSKWRETTAVNVIEPSPRLIATPPKSFELPPSIKNGEHDLIRAVRFFLSVLISGRKADGEVVVGGNNNFINTFSAYVLSKVSGKRLVLIIHHYDVLNATGEPSANFWGIYSIARRNGRSCPYSLTKAMLTLLSIRMAKSAKGRILISPIFARLFEGSYLVSGNGIDEVNTIHGHNQEDIDCVYVGRVTKSKGVLNLLDIWGKLVGSGAPLRLLLIGQDAMDIKREIKRRSLEKFVQYLGELPSVERDSYVGSAKAFVTASTAEGWGIAISEALAQGTPVVCFATPALTQAWGKTPGVSLVSNEEEFLKKVRQVTDSQVDREIVRSGTHGMRGWDEIASAELDYIASIEDPPIESPRGRRTLVVGPSSYYLGGISYYTSRVVEVICSHEDVVVLYLRKYIPSFLFPGGNRNKNFCQSKVSPPRTISYDGLDYDDPRTWLSATMLLIRIRPRSAIFQWWTVGTLPIYFPLLLLCKILGTRVILEVHELSDPSESEYKLVSFVSSRALAFVTRLSFGVICHSEYFRARVADLAHLDASRISVSPHLPYTYLSSASVPQGGSTGRNVLFLGLLRRYKGIETLAEAYEILKSSKTSISLLIAGESWDYGDEYIQQLRTKGIEVVNRYLTDNEMATALAWADVVVLPYTRDSVSGIMALAVSYGRKIVVSDFPSPRESLKGYKLAFFFSPGSAKDLAEAILRALKCTLHVNEIDRSREEEKATMYLSVLDKSFSIDKRG